jgi:hypothetical protein
MDLKEIGCDNGSLIKLVQDHIQWSALVLLVLNLHILLSDTVSSLK